MTNTSFIDDLRDIPSFNNFTGAGAATVTKAAKPVQTFPCENCGGTGKYRGVRLHQQATECFACGGRGWFKTSYKDRMAKRQQAADRKAATIDMAKAVFNEANPGLIEALTGMMGWNDFARTMIGAYHQYGSLTERQVTACQNMIAKVAAKRAEKDAAKVDATGPVDTSAIEAMFQTARDNGLNKLAFRAGGLTISPAKATSKNAGALYVKRGDDYMGKIMGGRFMPVSGADAGVLETLRVVAVNPSQAARDYGKRTGICCCCGRELTDPESIAAGIGPICESNWGL